MNSFGKRLRELVLTVGAVAGLACLALAIGSAAFGLRPLVVQSGSMEPAIATGSLLITRDTPAADLKVADVVTVQRADGVLVTHRVVEIEPRGEAAALRLKGDANNAIDADVYVVERAGRMVMAIPYLGWVAAKLSSPLGLFGLGLYTAFLLTILIQGLRRRGRDRGGKRKAGKRRTDVIAAGCGALLIFAAINGQVAPNGTLAEWSDTAGVAGTALSTYTVPKPVWVSCTITGGALSQKTATIVWQEVSSPYPLDYTATIRQTGQSITVTDNGSTRQTQFSAGLLSTILNQTYHIDIQARLPAPNTHWVSPILVQPVTITLLGLGMTCGTPS